MSAAELPIWTAEERESFFAAIARHRRAAWQVSAVAGVCIAILRAQIFLFVLGANRRNVSVAKRAATAAERLTPRR